MDRRTFIAILGVTGAALALPATATSACAARVDPAPVPPTAEERDRLFFVGIRRRMIEALEKGYPVTGFTILRPENGWRLVIFHFKTATTYYGEKDLRFYHPFDVLPGEDGPRYWRPPVGIATWLCPLGHKSDLLGTPGTRKMTCLRCRAYEYENTHRDFGSCSGCGAKTFEQHTHGCKRESVFCPVCPDLRGV